ncbi:MAG: DUF58 domain-containing protein [Magnetococcus sp. THC-1_WYH]
MNRWIQTFFWIGARRLHFWSFWFTRSWTPMGKRIVVGALAGAIFGINTELSMVYQVFSLLLALMLFAVIAAPFSRVRLAGSRQLPAQVIVGKPFEYELHLGNPTGIIQNDVVIFENFPDPRPDFNLFLHSRGDPVDRRRNIYDRWVGFHRFVGLTEKKLGIRVDKITIDAIPPHGEVHVRIKATATRRGTIHFSGLAIGRADPLGLFYRFSPISIPGTVLAVPQSYPLPQTFHISGGRRHLPGGMAMAAGVGEMDECVALRDYRPGDSPRSFYWPALAKTGKWVVVERQEEFFVRHGLVLDTLHQVPEAVFEDAVSLAASLAVRPGHPDGLLDLLFVGLQTVQLTIGRGLGGYPRILEALATAQMQGEQPFSRLSQRVLSQVQRFSGLFIILIHWDQDRENWVRALVTQGVPLRIFLIQGEDSPPPSVPIPKGRFPGFFLLRSGAIRQGLMG